MNAPAFQLFLDAVANTTAPEWIAIITALVYVVLATLENSWCWIFGIISSAIYIKINYDAKIYLESWLSLYYVLIGIYGWYIWIKKIPAKSDSRSLRKIKPKEFLLFICIGTIATFILGTLSDKYTDSPLPYFDGALASFSLVATFMTTQKILENWLFWVVIDAAYVIIYLQRSFPFTAILFLIYTFIAAYGYFKWRKKLLTFAA